MADDADRAQVINDQLLSDALDRRWQPHDQNVSRTHCKDCEEPIPLARQKAIPGVMRCVGCQEIYENWRPL